MSQLLSKFMLVHAASSGIDLTPNMHTCCLAATISFMFNTTMLFSYAVQASLRIARVLKLRIPALTFGYHLLMPVRSRLRRVCGDWGICCARTSREHCLRQTVQVTTSFEARHLQQARSSVIDEPGCLIKRAVVMQPCTFTLIAIAACFFVPML